MKIPTEYNRFWKKAGTEVVFGLIAVFSFGTYLLNLNRAQESGSVGQALADLESGAASRKKAGQSEFVPTQLGDRLYNRDVISVDDGAYAVLHFLSDDSEMLIRGGSLVVLSRSLKMHDATEIRVILGSVDLKRKTWAFKQTDYDIQNGLEKVKAPTLFPSSSPSPESSDEVGASPSESPEPRGQPAPMASIEQVYGIHPKQNSVLLKSRGDQSDVIFSWPDALTGQLWIADETGKKISDQTVNSTSQMTVKLNVNQIYTWGITSSGKNLGPYTFKLYSTKQHPLAGFIGKTQSSATVEVLP